jgi:hypothetical protein
MKARLALVIATTAVSTCCATQPAQQVTAQPISATDKWRNAESSLVRAFLERGDVVGAARAEHFIYNMSGGKVGQPMSTLESLPDTAQQQYPPPSIHCTTESFGHSITTDCQ